MSTQENLTDDTLVGADDDVAAANGGAAVVSDTLTLAEMNATLGKDFKDKDSALKALKDTFSYVGKKRETVAAELAAETKSATAQNPDFASKSDVQQLKNQLFFAQNPEYKGYENIIKMMGSDPSEVTASEEFKTVFNKVKIADEAEQKKSVVQSNSRLGETKTLTDSAVEVANARNSSVDDVAATLARGINELMSGQS